MSLPQNLEWYELATVSLPIIFENYDICEDVKFEGDLVKIDIIIKTLNLKELSVIVNSVFRENFTIIKLLT